MSFPEIDPQRAHDLMRGDPPHAYLDVRTEEEFEDGHPEGAVNVPIATFSGGGMAGNPDFLRVVAAHFPKDAPLVVGCKMGGRSRKACELLAQAGFTRLHNVDGGFSGNPGSPQPNARRGWEGLGLPVATQGNPGATYAELARKANG